MSDRLQIDLLDGRTVYGPGDVVAGTLTWVLPKATKSLEVRLSWSTSGRGSQDEEVAASVRFEQPLEQDVQPFELVLPMWPWSFSGALVSLMWQVEAATRWGGEQTRKRITVSPTGEEQTLPRLPAVDDKAMPSAMITSSKMRSHWSRYRSD